jgi:hypothetical protein
MKYKSSSRSQKQKSRRSRSRSRGRSRSRTNRRSQRGGLLLNPSLLSNSSNSHFAGKGFTDPQGAVTGCTGSPNSASALKGADIFTTIGGIRMPVMKGGQHIPFYLEGGRRRSCNKRKCNHKYHRMQRGGSHTMNTNGYSIAGVELKPSLSGIANNYHTAYDSCKV